MNEFKILKKLKLLQIFNKDLNSRLDVHVSEDEKLSYKSENANIDQSDLVNWVLNDKVVFRLFVSVEEEVKL